MTRRRILFYMELGVLCQAVNSWAYWQGSRGEPVMTIINATVLVYAFVLIALAWFDA